MRAPFAFSWLRFTLFVYLPMACLYFQYYNHFFILSKTPTLDRAFLEKPDASERLSEILTARTHMMNVESELENFLRKEHPINTLVLPRLEKASRRLDCLISDVHAFMKRFEDSKVSYGELNCFYNASRKRIEKMNKYLEMVMALKELRVDLIAGVIKRVKGSLQSSGVVGCGKEFQPIVIPSKSEYGWNQNHKKTLGIIISDDTFEDITLMQELLAMFEELSLSSTKPMANWTSLDAGSSSSPEFKQLKNDIYKFYMDNEEMLQLVDYNILRSVSRIRRHLETLNYKETKIWAKEVAFAVNQVDMKVRLGFNVLSKLSHRVYYVANLDNAVAE